MRKLSVIKQKSVSVSRTAAIPVKKFVRGLKSVIETLKSSIGFFEQSQLGVGNKILENAFMELEILKGFHVKESSTQSSKTAKGVNLLLVSQCVEKYVKDSRIHPREESPIYDAVIDFYNGKKKLKDFSPDMKKKVMDVLNMLSH